MKKHFALGVLAASLTGAAHAQLSEFSESFDGADLNTRIMQLGVGSGEIGAAGRWDTAGGVYVLSPTRNNEDDIPHLGRLRIDTGGTLEDFSHEVTVDLVDFFGGPTQAQSRATIVLKAIGPGGNNFQVFFNSFGDLRVNHNPPTPRGDGDLIAMTSGSFAAQSGIADGQSLTLRQEYRAATDTISVLYSIDGGEEQLIYSGGGYVEGVDPGGLHNGVVGDIITSAIEVEVNQFGDGSAPRPVVHVSSWSFGAPTVIPEPGTYALLAGCFGLVAVMLRRR